MSEYGYEPTMDLELNAKYTKWIDKKTQGKPAPMRALMRRTTQAAVNIVSIVNTLPFEKLSASLYFYCKEVETKDLTRKYESQLELASINADAFIRGLHSML